VSVTYREQKGMSKDKNDRDKRTLHSKGPVLQLEFQVKQKLRK
jgi:hypothetical protein